MHTKQRGKKLKICFVAPYAYSLFNQQTTFTFGGSEVRTYIIASGLAARDDVDVSIVVYNHGQPKTEKFENVTVYRGNLKPLLPTSFAKKYTALFHMRLKTLGHLALRALGMKVFRLQSDGQYRNYHPMEFSVYKSVDADVYCTLGATSVSADVAAFCKSHNKKLLIWAASDEDFSNRYYSGSTERSTYGNIGFMSHYALVNADLIFVQSRQQQETCQERFGIASTVVRNPYSFVDLPEKKTDETEKYILWIGKSDRNKQPDLLLDVAQKIPEINFKMVMNKSHPSFFDWIIKNAPSNVEIIERASFEDVSKMFRDATALLNTSDFEGFPNTFLQSAQYAVPIASLNVDPDGLIDQCECGFFANGDLDKLANGLKKLIKEPTLRKKYGTNLAQYARQFHQREMIIEQFLHEMRKTMFTDLKK